MGQSSVEEGIGMFSCAVPERRGTHGLLGCWAGVPYLRGEPAPQAGRCLDTPAGPLLGGAFLALPLDRPDHQRNSRSVKMRL